MSEENSSEDFPEVVDPVFKSPNAEEIESLSDYEKFEILNKDLEISPKIDIDGNKYTKVSVRLNLFRKYFGLEYSLSTERLMTDDSHILFKTTILNVKNNSIVASGHSEKKRFSDSASAGLEFAETASIGRALSSFGIIGGEFASIDEIGVESQELAGAVAVNVIKDLASKVGEKIENIEINLRHKRIALILKNEALGVITKLYVMLGDKRKDTDEQTSDDDASGDKVVQNKKKTKEEPKEKKEKMVLL